MIRLRDYTLGAVGVNEFKAAAARAKIAAQRRCELDPAAELELGRAVHSLGEHFQTFTLSPDDDIAVNAAQCALWAVGGLMFLLDSDFYTLYLPFAIAVEYGSLLAIDSGRNETASQPTTGGTSSMDNLERVLMVAWVKSIASDVSAAVQERADQMATGPWQGFEGYPFLLDAASERVNRLTTKWIEQKIEYELDEQAVNDQARADHPDDYDEWLESENAAVRELIVRRYREVPSPGVPENA